MRVPAARVVCRIGFFAVCFGVCTTPATADEFLWQGGSLGLWDDPDRWLNLDSGGMGVPGDSDDGLFSPAGGASNYFVNFATPGTRPVGSLQVHEGILFLRSTLTDDSASLSLQSFNPSTPSLSIGNIDDAQLSLLVTAFIHPFTIEGVHGAIGQAGAGTLVVNNPDVTLDFSGTIDLGGVGQEPGKGGTGTVDLQSGLVRASWIRQGLGGPGNMEVSGSESQLEVPIRWSVGYDDMGFARIRDGANVAIGDLSIGTRPGSDGRVIVDDGGSLTVDGSVDVGVFGEGRLDIEDAGFISIGGSLAIGVGRQDDIWGFPVAVGIGVFDNLGQSPSCLCIGGDLAVGLAGEGELRTRSIHTIDVAGDFIATTVDSTIDVQLESPKSAADPILSFGGTIDPITIDVSVSSSAGIALGDTYVLVKALSTPALGPITVDVAPMQGSLQLLRRDFDGELRLLVVNRGDIDGDGIVGFTDLAALLAAWGICDGCPADLDGDGVVVILDLIILLNNWGS